MGLPLKTEDPNKENYERLNSVSITLEFCVVLLKKMFITFVSLLKAMQSNLYFNTVLTFQLTMFYFFLKLTSSNENHTMPVYIHCVLVEVPLKRTISR